jgi:hypothetical protein
MIREDLMRPDVVCDKRGATHLALIRLAAQSFLNSFIH